ncbi:hypothetical protein Cpir12675_006404 [Ceratocystis pirilliformis]|uniref:Inheritance of peroxisomes protein 1 n=1 Tax=Ceratocystis pirilliformis TaxID=259994 RepID=A0ABR3YJ04_9PEZI
MASASEAAQSRYAAGTPTTTPSPNFAASTRAAASRSRTTPRRVVTNPTPRLASSVPSQYNASSPANASLAESKANKKVETLYSHPNVKIIAFSATARTAPRGSASQHSPKEVLTWSSHMERTIAVGAFKIYRAPGSVAFLNCGSALQPILPKSQCWCLDEEGSRFVLQIRRPQYWRIELPLDSSDDCHRAEILRDILSGILLFEKTVCPFERTFAVEISDTPEDCTTASTKRQLWQPSDTAFVSPLGPYDKSPSTADMYGNVRSENSQQQQKYHCSKSSDSTLERPTTSHSESSLSGTSEVESEYCLEESYLLTPKLKPAHLEVKPMVTNLEAKISAESRRQEWIRKQYVHSLQDDKNKGPAFLDDLDEFDDDTSDIGSVVSDLTHVRTMTSRSLYSRQRETTIFEAEDAAARPGRNISRDVRRSSNEIHEGSGMGGNSVLKKRLRRPGFQAPRSGNMPPHMSMSSSTSMAAAGDRAHSRPQSPLSMAPRTVPPLTMAPRPAHLKSARMASSSSSTSSTHSSVSTVSTSSSQVTVTASPISPGAPETSPGHSSTEKESSRQNAPSATETLPAVDCIETTERKPSDLSAAAGKNSEKKMALSLDTTCSLAAQKNTKIQASTNRLAQSGEISPTIATPSSPLKRCMSPITSLLHQRASHRTTTSISQRTALSPLPSIADLFSRPSTPPSKRNHNVYNLVHTGDHLRRIPWSIMAKTCDLILGPPRNLLRLMLHVAAKIVAGQWRGSVYGHGANGTQIPVHWDYSDDFETVPDQQPSTIVDDIDENGDDYYARGRKLASGWLSSDEGDLD